MSALPPKADMCSALADVRFGPIADTGLSALRTKTHSRSRKCLIRRLLNAPQHKLTNECDDGCCNACKNEDPHDPPLSLLRLATRMSALGQERTSYAATISALQALHRVSSVLRSVIHCGPFAFKKQQSQLLYVGITFRSLQVVGSYLPTIEQSRLTI